jgi:ElaB/YqjD/DUF883 family membrane-anchored ribosome-binding protein
METNAQTPCATEKLHSAEKLVSDLKSMIQRAEQTAIGRARAADQVVRGHPYATIGMVFGLGLLVGLVIRRK